MNNALVIKAKDIDEAVEMASEGVDKNDTIVLSRTLKHLSSLRGTIHFKEYIHSFVTPEIQSYEKKLKTEKELSEIRYLQGFIAGLEKFKNIERFEKIYKLKLENQNKNDKGTKKR